MRAVLSSLQRSARPDRARRVDDLPGELHCEILRLVPLRDATAARVVSREMRGEVDEVWRAWGIRATVEDTGNDLREYFKGRIRDMELDCGPVAVHVFGGSHAHHLASLGLWWLAVLVAEAPDLHGMSWRKVSFQQSPLTVAVLARRPVGRGADGKVEWAYALGNAEVARAVRGALAMGVDVKRRLQGAWPLMTYCAGRGCLEAVKACLAAGAEVDLESKGHWVGWYGDRYWWTALVFAAYRGHEAVVEALLEAGASAKVGPGGEDRTLATVCEGHTTLSIVRRLAEAGADVNAPGDPEYPSDEGITALSHAADRGDVAMMGLLVELGIAVADMHNRHAMRFAANGEVVRWLAARGLSVQALHVCLPALHMAVTNDRLDAFRDLVELGADVEGSDWHYGDIRAAR